MVIDGQRPRRGDIHAENTGAQRGEIGTAASRHEQPLSNQVPTAIDRDAELAVIVHLRCAGTGDHIDAFAMEHVGEQVAGLGFLQRQQSRQRLHDRDVDAESGVDLRQLGTDRTAAEHDDRARKLLSLDRLPARARSV